MTSSMTYYETNLLRQVVSSDRPHFHEGDPFFVTGNSPKSVPRSTSSDA